MPVLIKLIDAKQDCPFRCTPMTLRHAGGRAGKRNVVHRRCGSRCPVLRTEPEVTKAEFEQRIDQT
ncbi:MAG: hypothetical protein ACLSFT_07465 [Ruminococcus callidus]